MYAFCHSKENTDYRVVFHYLEDHYYIVHFQRDYDHQTWTAYTPLRENVGSYPSQSASDVIGTQCPDFDKYSYIHFCWGYGHQMSAAGTPLGEESSGDLSPGTGSSNINEVIRAVLNFFFFFTKRFCEHKKHKNANKRISDFFPLRCFLCA